MDRLTALIAIAQLRLRLDVLTRYPHLLEDNMTTPKLQGLAEAMKKFEHGLEDSAGKLLAKIEQVGSRGQTAIAKGHQKIDGKAALVAEIENYVTALEGANGGDPLEDSSDSSEQSEAEPEKSFGAANPLGGPRILS